MPGTTLRLDEVEHKMLQMLCLKTGRTQSQILRGLLRREFASHGITREQVEQMTANPDRFWGTQRRLPPEVVAGPQATLLARIAAYREAQSGDAAVLDAQPS